ncbi:hypothetical protein HO133_005857 [Letharia lupina]|uniref:Uncharacterized protein n=1 Tax=Letharia lupina TaxID=560253 RepID=A0A8H6F8C6_9LECA|nr:uncharacterized protein HO133_005857 [Letharia lupina]KAF6218508.1 hypothetical protein HO133_005857 [Letharia lupina]
MVAGYAGKENLRLESEIDERIHDLISLIERKRMDMAQKAQFFTLDVISGWAFDQAFGDLIVDEDVFEYIKTVDKAMHVLLSMSELPDVYSFPEKSSLMKLVAPSATDRIGFGKLIAIAKEKVAERFGDNRKVKVLWRLKAEIDEAVDNGSISSPTQDSEARPLLYLQACMKEGLRLWPPVTGLFPKVVPPEGETSNGVFLPGGIEIG